MSERHIRYPAGAVRTRSYIRAIESLTLHGNDGETVKIEGPGLDEPIIGKLLHVSDAYVAVELPTVGQTHFINPAMITSIKVKTAEA